MWMCSNAGISTGGFDFFGWWPVNDQWETDVPIMRCTPATKGLLTAEVYSWKFISFGVSFVFCLYFFREMFNFQRGFCWRTFFPVGQGNMKKLLAAKTAFGIIPGGSEDVAIHEYGKENVYINSRYGFIKYALQHGYSLILAYTFGENDQFYSLSWLRPLNMWLVKRFWAEFLLTSSSWISGNNTLTPYIAIHASLGCPKRIQKNPRFWLRFAHLLG